MSIRDDRSAPPFQPIAPSLRGSSPGRTRAVVALALAGLAVGAGGPLAAQEFPSRPVRLIVPFAPGGLADTSARAVADRLGVRLGQGVPVENRAGASGNIGMQVVAQSPPDGHTLVLGFDGTVVINPHIFAKPGFDSLADFAPVTKLGDATLLLVAHPSVPVRNIRELIALEKSRPGSLSYGTSGTGGTPHMVGELLNQRLGAKFVHVPYKGGGQAVIDVVGGQIPLVFTAVASAQQHVKSGRLVGIGVTSARRSSSLPEVPTLAESGLPDFVVDSWVGVLAPARTPRPVVDRLHRELVEVLKEPDVRSRYSTLGIEPVGNTPDQFAAQIRADLARWEKVVRTAGIKVD
jgi:tripartite-type tricarboxylate transporter receptor subunit TctC